MVVLMTLSVTRWQTKSSKVTPRVQSRQISYPLSLRGQVCEAQSPLPCFPSTALSTWHPAFLDRVPVSPVPRCHRYYQGATTSRHAYPVAYLLRFRGPRDPPQFVSRNLRSQKVGEPSGPGSIVQPATRSAGLLARGRERDLPGSQAIHPVPLPRSPTPAEPTTPRLLTVSPMLPPRFPRRRLQRFMNFGAQSRGLGTRCLRFTSDVATTHAKLASGWLA